MRGKLASSLIDYDDLDQTYARLRLLAARPEHKIARLILVLGGVATAIAVVVSVTTLIESTQSSQDMENPFGVQVRMLTFGLAGTISAVTWAALVTGIGAAISLLDRLVWLRASDEDRLTIYCRRHSITPREALTEFDSEEDSKNA